MTRDDAINTVQFIDNLYREPCTKCKESGRQPHPKRKDKTHQCTKCRGSGKKPLTKITMNHLK